MLTKHLILLLLIIFFRISDVMAESSADNHPTVNQPRLKTFRVVIDPGHGGSDLGTSRDSFVESHIVYQIAQKLNDKLNFEKSRLPLTQSELLVHLTRQQNQGLSLPERVKIANQLHADLFVSLHANSSSSQLVNGMEFYFGSDIKPRVTVLDSTKKKLQSDDSLEDAQDVVEKIKQELVQFGKIKRSLEFTKATQKQTIDHKSVIRRAPFYVIENTTMPAVLIEVGFISNRREAKKLVSEDYQNEIAQVLTQAILEYKEKSDKNFLVNEN